MKTDANWLIATMKFYRLTHSAAKAWELTLRDKNTKEMKGEKK